MAKLLKSLPLNPLRLHKKVEQRQEPKIPEQERWETEDLGSSPTNQSNPTSKPQVQQETLL